MNKDVKYSGLTAVPSDYECGDGDLAAVLNLVPEDGSLKPVQPPKTILTLDKGVRVLFIHKTASFTHYIIYDERTSDGGAPTTNGLYWIESTATTFTPKGSTASNYLGAFASLYGANAVGNTLLFLSTDGVQYYLWKDSAYKYLGDHLPDLSISFGLQGHPEFYIADDDYYDTYKNSSDSDKKKKALSQLTFVYRFRGSYKSTALTYSGNDLADEDITPFTNCVMGNLNKTIKEKATDKGRFALPFLVRYALRLYDGSLIHHSAPILMTPASNGNEFVMADRADGGTEGYLTMSIMIIACDLDYQVVADGYGESSNLSDWSDIITSVDIFASKPIYPYDQSGQLKTPVLMNSKQLYEKSEGEGATVFYGKIAETPLRITTVTQDGSSSTISTSSSYYIPWNYDLLRNMFYNGLRSDTVDKYADGFTKGNYLNNGYKTDAAKYPLNQFLQLPKWEDEDADKNDINKSVSQVSTFYLLKKIDLTDVSIGTRKVIDIEDDYLSALTSRETMTDDYLTHERIIANNSHVYNNRVNFAGVRKIMFRGFSAESMRCYINTAKMSANDSWAFDTSSSTITIKLQSAVRTSTQNITCKITDQGEMHYVTCKGVLPLYWWYEESGIMYSYPSLNAVTLWEWTDGSTYLRKLELQKHDFLNLSYSIIPYSKYLVNSTKDLNNTSPGSTSESLPVVDASNKLYTSEVNNPFLIKASGINSVGTGKILGISSAVKALSQGQFGQFPLYAFTTDGVWALEVSSTGGYSAKQPVTRDVCVDADSITQLDSAVLFATDRGIMMLEGSETACFTDIINGDNTLAVAKLPNIGKLAALSSFTEDDITIEPFADFCKSCRMIYDYTHQRVILYNPSRTYAYIYSLKSKQWGMMQSTIASDVNSYPDALAMQSDGSFVNLSGEDTESDYKGILVTRPLKLDMPDVHKTISSIIQRGFFRSGHVRGILYGSRDLFNWFTVWTSTDHYMRGFSGTPYKYFRLALLCDLADDENLTGFTVSYDPRMTNKIR